MRLQKQEEKQKPQSLRFNMKEQLEKWLWDNAPKLPSKPKKEKAWTK